MLNYKQLYYFWNVAKYGGVTRAAEQLCLTPQTISGQVSELEQALEVVLFDRSGRRLQLSSAGEQAYAYADDIFQMGKELEAPIGTGHTTARPHQADLPGEPARIAVCGSSAA